MKYCSNCGNPNLEFKVPEGDNLKRYCCDECETIFYTNPNIVVGALCMRDGKILMAKRNINPRIGLWTLPAGFMENAETLQDGALRETFEETGSKAEIIMPYTMFSLPHINQVHMFYLANLLMIILDQLLKVLKLNYLRIMRFYGMKLLSQQLKRLLNIILKISKRTILFLEKKISNSGNYFTKLLALIKICIHGENSFQSFLYQLN